MSFETKLVNLINEIYATCVFRDRNGLFRKYSLESRVKLIPNIYTKEVEGFNHPPFKGSIQAELRFSDDEPRAKETYIRRFNEEILKPLDAWQVVSELEKMTGVDDSKIILLCYEKPKDFCHRHLVAGWLTRNSFEIKEFDC